MHNTCLSGPLSECRRPPLGRAGHDPGDRLLRRVGLCRPRDRLAGLGEAQEVLAWPMPVWEAQPALAQSPSSRGHLCRQPQRVLLAVPEPLEPQQAAYAALWPSWPW